MKKSLIIRWSIILLVVIAWTWSMFPITDRDYLNEFQKMAQKQVDKLARDAEQVPLITQAEELKIKIEKISDKEGEEYKQLTEQHQKLTSSRNISNRAKNRRMKAAKLMRIIRNCSNGSMKP